MKKWLLIFIIAASLVVVFLLAGNFFIRKPNDYPQYNPSGICGDKYCLNGSPYDWRGGYNGTVGNFSNGDNYSNGLGNYSNGNFSDGGWHNNYLNITPKLENLGVDFEPWNKTTGYAGSFEFNENVITHNSDPSVDPGTNKVFLEYGIYVKDNHNSQKVLPHYTYILPYGTKIIAVSKMNIDIIAYQSDSKDYEVQASYESENGSKSTWRIDYDHIINLSESLQNAFNSAVQSGKTINSSISSQTTSVNLDVNSGDTIGASPGVTELMVFSTNNKDNNILTYCPLYVMDPAIQNSYEQKVIQLENDWEKFTGNSGLYDQSKEILPGCLKLTI